MFNVGRNNPRVQAALQEALELDTPGKLALGVSTPAGAMLAEELLKRAPASLGRVLFTSSGTEAVEAAIKLGRAATGRTRVISVEHAFHGLTLGSLSANGDPHFSSGSGRRARFFAGAVRRPRCARGRAPTRGRGAFPRRAGARQGRQPAAGRIPRGGAGAMPALRDVVRPRRGADRFRAHREALRLRALGRSSRTSSPSPSRCRAGTSRLARCSWPRTCTTRVFDSLEHSVSHGSTFAPNDLAMAAGLATLRELDEARLVERSARLGELLLERTRALVDMHDVVQRGPRPRIDVGDGVAEPEAGARRGA